MSNNPFLQGGYAPVLDELDQDNLPVIGELPKDLHGIYMRNGPNPQFTPISYTFPFDGDGMIHAVYLENGKARYRNRFVLTEGLQAERRAGRAIYGGIQKPVIPDPKFAGANADPFKNGAFVSVIRHANKYLALLEACPAYEINRELETLGEWTLKDKLLSVNAHGRLDPDSGDLYLFSYDIFKPPYLTYYVFDKNFNLKYQQNIDKPRASMMHDMLITENYVVFVDCPAIFNPNGFNDGKAPFLHWDATQPTRIGIQNRHDPKAPMRWIDTEAFFVFHFANAYETEEAIIIDYAHHPQLNFGPNADKNRRPPMAYQLKIKLDSGSVSQYQLDDRTMEFPRINESYTGKANRYYYAPIKSAASFTQLKKYDTKTGQHLIHEFGPHHEIDEAVFASRQNSKSEDDGYIMLFVYDRKKDTSEFVIIDAKQFNRAPIARVQLPRRVPHGLHGAWMAG
ncbi:MAG: carotenoid oxygenase family protein [Gammaproteobacteria bacterium]|nr:carotenoid oxygenase family protein [Gammaproteobacteria bacterium]